MIRIKCNSARRFGGRQVRLRPSQASRLDGAGEGSPVVQAIGEPAAQEAIESRDTQRIVEPNLVCSDSDFFDRLLRSAGRGRYGVGPNGSPRCTRRN